MKCSRDFIVSYNHIFKFIHQHQGEDVVERFWELLADLLCQKLIQMAKSQGVAGLAQYWIESLHAEGADCEIVYCSKQDSLTIEMVECPAFSKLMEAGESPYENYCGHCQIMYAKALGELGIEFKCTHQNNGRCFIKVFKKDE